MKRILPILLTVLLCCSCNNLFWDDELDYQWRMDAVEFHTGLDFDGNPAGRVEKRQCWLSMARDLAVFECLENPDQEQRYIGSFSYDGDSISFDYSKYGDSAMWNTRLSQFGLPGVTSRFKVVTLDRKQMVLSGNSTTIYFTRW